MSKSIVLTEEEIKNVKKIKEDFQILVGQVGEVEVGIMNTVTTKRRKKRRRKKMHKRFSLHVCASGIL